MDSITTALVLLLAVVVSGPLTRASPLPVPLPLVQIGIGVGIAMSADLSVVLQPEVFFLLFLPPLLFLDGWRISKEGLFRDGATILALALGLVVFTVLGVGLFIHWLIPAMPLAVAFALAAILSPTDPIAVSAIANRVPIPKRLMHILEGESLLNDASGLVCMRFAVAAALTGSFSLMDAIGTFAWLAAGGIAIGVLVAMAVIYTKNYVSRRYGEETGSQILISLLIPFAAYLAAEHLESSGILAAVAAGIAMSFAEQRGQTAAQTRIRRASFWDTVQFSANGVVFVLLGEQLPRIADGAARAVRETGHLEPIWLLVYIVAINAALIGLRFLWTFLSLRFTLLRAARRGVTVHAPSRRLVAATALAGVRGAITLAGILTLPLTMMDGTPFPARDLAIFLAAGTIIVSLLIASFGLPALLKGLKLPPEPTHAAEEDHARNLAARAAIHAIEAFQHDLGKGRADADLYAEAAARVMELYRLRLDHASQTGEAADRVRRADDIEKALRLAGIQAERDVYFRLSRERRLDQDTSRKLVREIDLHETRLLGS
ncbi:Na+/H+ antiporter [Aureimonas frigidaquae]|uniref:Na+/H+ antiporter n=1 Tax=Aureimonas frigidaquae TaxID=424757 RepID=UPI0007846E25|nr:Na+/H+ antiporter [Aureimonas frigidaquae]